MSSCKTSEQIKWRAPITLSAMHVMIFDDDYASRSALRQALKSTGIMYITEASNHGGGHNGGPFIPSAVDVVVSALHLEAGSGLMLLKAIRTGLIRDIKPDVCFIFVSEAVETAVVSAAAQLDANGYLVKPVGAARLRAAILRGRAKGATMDKTKYAAAHA